MKEYKLQLSDEALEILIRVLGRAFQLNRKPEIDEVIIDVEEQLEKQCQPTCKTN